MKVLNGIDPEIIEYLDEFRHWVFAEKTQQSIYNKFKWPEARFNKENKHLDSCSPEFLMSMDHSKHIGFPTDLYGVDLNYETIRKNTTKADPHFFNEIREVNYNFDEKLQNALGARHPSLKAFYPAQGYIAWHTNWNAPGYNIIFTYSKTGKGFWRHIDPQGCDTHVPNPKKMVQIDDQPGWHCKVGYYGSKEETEKLMWHSAYTDEPRITVGYIIYDKNIWENMIEDIEVTPGN